MENIQCIPSFVTTEGWVLTSFQRNLTEIIISTNEHLGLFFLSQKNAKESHRNTENQPDVLSYDFWTSGLSSWLGDEFLSPLCIFL
jgi:hypothetical protein